MIDRLTVLLLLTSVLFGCGQDDSVINQPDQPEPSFTCDVTPPIYNQLSEMELLDSLRHCFSPEQIYDYQQARIFLYSEVDVFNDQVETIYSKYRVSLTSSRSQEIIDEAFEKGINCEHTFPQSRGAGEEPARSDMYHIYPEREGVNADRSFYPYGDFSSTETSFWFLEDKKISEKPENEQDWAKVSESLARFEPSDDRKGDVARSIFYFVLIYDNVADRSYFESMDDVLHDWHKQDPVDERERTRASRVEELQGNKNPFIVDEELAERVFGQ